MKLTPSLAALAGALALMACGETEEADYTEETAAPAADDTTVITREVPVEVPADDGTSSDADGSKLTIDGRDLDATISEDSVKADIKVDTRD